MLMCNACNCPRRPEKDITSPGIVVTGDCEFLMHLAWVLQTELISSGKGPKALKTQSPFPSLYGNAT